MSRTRGPFSQPSRNAPLAPDGSTMIDGTPFRTRAGRIVGLDWERLAARHSCDVCGGTFAEQDIARMGGDRWVRGSLVATPTECAGCAGRSRP